MRVHYLAVILGLGACAPAAAQGVRGAHPVPAVQALRQYLLHRSYVAPTAVTLIICRQPAFEGLDPQTLVITGQPGSTVTEIQAIAPCKSEDPWPRSIRHWPAVRISSIRAASDSIVIEAESGFSVDQRTYETAIVRVHDGEVRSESVRIGPTVMSQVPAPPPDRQR